MDYGYWYLHHIVPLGDGSYGPVEDLYSIFYEKSAGYLHRIITLSAPAPNTVRDNTKLSKC